MASRFPKKDYLGKKLKKWQTLGKVATSGPRIWHEKILGKPYDVQRSANEV